MLSDMLRRKGVPHNVLNAKLHEKEAAIVAQAGRPSTVTIATNMAGRGVDILLGGNPDGLARELLAKQALDMTTATPEQWQDALAKAKEQIEKDRARVVELGGLHIVGTERHEARRIDNQLRGRAGRQGDPGSSRFYISLEDDLMRRFGGERVKSFMEWAGLEEDVPIEHGLISKTIEQSQVKVEGYNFDLRKHVLQYDDVVNKQRETIYAQRHKVLSKDTLREDVLTMVHKALEAQVALHTESNDEEEWNLSALAGDVQKIIPLPTGFDIKPWRSMDRDEITDQLREIAAQVYDEQAARMGRQLLEAAQRNGQTIESLGAIPHPLHRAIAQTARAKLAEQYTSLAAERLTGLSPETQKTIEDAFAHGLALGRDRVAILQVVDRLWIRHLTVLDDLREGIGLRAFGQQDPLVSYKREGSESFGRLLGQIEQQVALSLFHLHLNLEQSEPTRIARETRTNRVEPARNARASASRDGKVGRNDPCYCGSGKKYKNCHMRKDQGQTHAIEKRK
ncbi:MAG: SEC-C domain-containing protein [Chloroflexi bacterium]|nr:SEC-C domain-containing protein [Chloroflexota bacterium]